jgi:hypothetical protein
LIAESAPALKPGGGIDKKLGGGTEVSGGGKFLVAASLFLSQWTT